VARRKGSNSQNDLPLARPSRDGPAGSLRQPLARFIAYYGTEEDADTESIELEKCGLCAAPLQERQFQGLRLATDRAGCRAEGEARLKVICCL